MKKPIIFLVAFFLIGCRTTPPESEVSTMPKDIAAGQVIASAILEAKSGSKVSGKAWFTLGEDGVQIVVAVKNVTPGSHGIHIHEKGDCSAEDASSAGDHYNPTKVIHGAPDPLKHHVGDFGNIEIDQDGNGALTLIIPRNHFHPDFPDWKDIVGKSVVLHSKPDDLKTQPSGDSGERIACGVINKE